MVREPKVGGTQKYIGQDAISDNVWGWDMVCDSVSCLVFLLMNRFDPVTASVQGPHSVLLVCTISAMLRQAHEEKVCFLFPYGLQKRPDMM